MLSEIDLSDTIFTANERLSNDAFDAAIQSVNHSILAEQLRRLRGTERKSDCSVNETRGEAPSVYKDAQRRFLQAVLAADADTAEYLRVGYSGKYDSHYVNGIPGWIEYQAKEMATLEPWSIPTEDELDTHFPHVPLWGKRNEKLERRVRPFWVANRAKAHFSAAAAAIHFLGSIPAATRQHLRRILVHEDRMSVNSAAGHGRGLVPFCLENPALRIERRVNLWRTCFLESTSEAFPHNPRLWLAHFVYVNDVEKMSAIHADRITKPVAEWMVEASLLPEAITLVLDGGPTPQHTSYIFQEVVQRDAAWQSAIELAFPPNDSEPFQPYRNRDSEAYHFDGFPQLLHALSDNERSSRVRCINLDPGRPWSEEQINGIVEANREYTHAFYWKEAWRRPGVLYRSVPLLPDVHSIKEEFVFPDGWIERYWEDESYGTGPPLML